jgi:Tol biopolymer transport system component
MKTALSAPRSSRLWLAAFVAITLLGGFAAPVSGQDEFPPGRIAFVRKGDIWIWQKGDAHRAIADGAASDPRWSPSGRFLLFVRSGDSFSDLILYDFDSGSEQQLTYNQSGYQPGSPDYVNTSSWVIDPDWSPSGLIAFASDATSDSSVILWLILDPSLPPEPAPSAEIEDDIEGVSLSADGTVAAYTVRHRDDSGANRTYVAIRDLSDGTPYVLADDPGGAFDPAIAPDGRSVALAIRGEDGVSDIWLVDRATGNRTRVTTNAQATQPAWSPDGQWLAYMRMVDYRFEVWAVPREGAGFGAPRRLFRYQNLDATSRISWTLS